MKIEVLRGAERVRRRPAVLFGSDDIEGVKRMLTDLLDIFLQEHQRGYGDRLTLSKFTDGALEIQYNGRGLYLDGTWQELFCALFADSVSGAAKRSAFDTPERGELDFLESLSLCAAQCASEYMEVRVIRDGYCRKLQFKQGEPTGQPEVTACTDPSGTTIRFKPDPLVFTETELPLETLEHALYIAALSSPGLQTCLLPENKVYFYPEGISGVLKQPVYSRSMEAKGQERYNRPLYQAKIRVALCFAQQGFVTCIHGKKELPWGGTHLDAILEKLHKYINWDLPGRISKKKLAEHLQLVIHTESDVTCWVTAGKMAIENKLLRDMAEDTIDEQFRTFLKENKEAIQKALKD